MTLDPLVIVPCGGKKCARPTVAGRMYIGGYHRACLRYALALAPATRVLILSAKYGLLALDDVIAPYDVRMGQPRRVCCHRARWTRIHRRRARGVADV